MDLPSDDTLRWIVARFARLRAAYGDALGEPDLVEPTGAFFPDAFSATPEGVGQLLQRTLSYAPLADDLPIRLAFVEGEHGGGGCGSGGCGTSTAPKVVASGEVTELPDGSYRVPARVADVGNATLLTASLARSVGSLILLEAEDEGAERELPTLSEIAAVASGLGLLLLNGACVYAKACSGLRAHQATRLDVSELAVAVALFCRVHGKKPGTVKAHLETTQAEAFAEALRWVDSNDALVAKLRATPELLADGVFPIEPVKGLLGRMFGKSKEPTLEEAAQAAAAATARAARPRSEAESRRIAETRALVEEALKGG